MPLDSRKPTKTTSVTISSGTSQSDVAFIDKYRIGAIQMPAAWDAAQITLLASDTETGTFNPVYKDDGSEVSITTAASRFVVLHDAAMSIAASQWLKLRSGTEGSPVNQASNRTLILVLLD